MFVLQRHESDRFDAGRRLEESLREFAAALAVLCEDERIRDIPVHALQDKGQLDELVDTVLEGKSRVLRESVERLRDAPRRYEAELRRTSAWSVHPAVVVGLLSSGAGCLAAPVGLLLTDSAARYSLRFVDSAVPALVLVTAVSMLLTIGALGVALWRRSTARSR